MNIQPMHLILAAGAAFVLVTFWIAHRNSLAKFDAFDLITENGRVSKIAVAFMVTLGVSTWVIVDQQINGKLSDGTFGLWLAAWVTPLTAKVIFNKNDPSSTDKAAS